MLEDTERKAKAYEKKRKKSFSEKTIQQSGGFGDRVNRDKIRFSGETMLEESILGIMLIQPELAQKAIGTLSADSFVTDFNRRVFDLFFDDFAAGREAILSKNGTLTPDELSTVSKYIAARKKFSENTEEMLFSLIETLKEQKKKQEYDKKIAENPLEGISDYINSLKRKNN